jgi:flagellar hook-basal body complex protein FliE
MAIVPITGGGVAPLRLDLLGNTNAAGKSAAGSGTGADGAASFGKAIGGALDHLNSLQNTADAYAQQAATGKLQNVEDYLTAATDSQLTTQLTVAVRNKAVEAFQEIMRMQV